MMQTIRPLPALILATALLLACAKQPAPPTTAPSQGQQEQTIKTMVTGIDQFDGGEVWGLNTGHGTFVVGPEVPGGVKSTVYERLIEAHDEVVTIRYMDIPATKQRVAHRLVTAIIIRDDEYRLDY